MGIGGVEEVSGIQNNYRLNYYGRKGSIQNTGYISRDNIITYTYIPKIHGLANPLCVQRNEDP